MNFLMSKITTFTFCEMRPTTKKKKTNPRKLGRCKCLLITEGH